MTWVERTVFGSRSGPDFGELSRAALRSGPAWSKCAPFDWGREFLTDGSSGSHSRLRKHRAFFRCGRGFASIFALFLVALVGAALLAVTSLMTTDVRRSTRGAVDAQLRQLLHAGAVAAVQRVRTDGALPDHAFDVALPRPLADAGAAVRVSREPGAAGEQIVAVIDVRLDDRTDRQRVVLARGGETWDVHAVRR